MERLKKVMIRVEPADWDLLKEITRETGSNASVEIRRFIKKYLAEHTDEIKKIMMKKGGQNV